MSLEMEPIVSRIIKLDDKVVNRIAAGEVVQRPASALKELMENSIDAESCSIHIMLNAGGLKLLQIQDDGKGIHRDDLNVVCQRFTTSKLKEFEDLSRITTYGFRGEALASISHVAHVTITSRVKTSSCAYRAKYLDGELFASADDNALPKPCAGNVGTIITVEDLFYNMPLRRKALNNPTEEYNKVLEVVNRYAIHNDGIAFSLKKHNEPIAVVNSPLNSSTKDRIRSIFGATIERELLEVDEVNQPYNFTFKGYLTNANFSGKRYIFILFINHRLVDCNVFKKSLESLYAQYLPKHTHPFIYISLTLDPQTMDVNVHPTKHEVHFLHEDTIVQCISKAVEKVLLNANCSRNFTFQKSLQSNNVINASQVLNTEPVSTTHREKPYDYKLVRTDPKSQKLHSFFNNSSVSDVVHSTHVDSDSYKEDKPLDLSCIVINDGDNVPRNDNISNFDTVVTTTTATSNNNSNNRNNNSIFDAVVAATTNNSNQNYNSNSNNDNDNMQNSKIAENGNNNEQPTIVSSCSSYTVFSDSTGKCNPKKPEQSQKSATIDKQNNHSTETRNIQLTSIKNLRHEVVKQNSKTLQTMLENHTFVGCVDLARVLIQYDTGLYMINMTSFTEELFYQTFLSDFGHFGAYRLSTSASIYELSLIGLECPDSNWKEEDGSKENLSTFISNFLVSKSEMLSDYLSIDIDSKGNLHTLPILLDNFTPNLNLLPLFILRLVTEIDWEHEQECFESIGRELSKFYAIRDIPQFSEDNHEMNATSEIMVTESEPKVDSDALSPWAKTIEFVIMPALRKGFRPPDSLIKEGNHAFQLADLHELYKVFERC